MAELNLPDLTSSGEAVDKKGCVKKGTAKAKMVAYILGMFASLFIVLMTYGVALIAFILSPLISWYLNRKAMALIHGSGIKVGPNQFDKIGQCVEDFSSRLGLKNVPDVYIVEDSVLNAAAVKYGKKDVILLTDNLVSGCLESGNPKALAFVLGHELGHIALGHNNTIRSFISRVYKTLGRLDEYSCDNIGLSLVQDRAVALQGLVILTVGPRLSQYANYKEISKQAQEVVDDKYSKKAERSLTHPLLLNRIHNIIHG